MLTNFCSCEQIYHLPGLEQLEVSMGTTAYSMMVKVGRVA